MASVFLSGFAPLRETNVMPQASQKKIARKDAKKRPY